MKEIDKDKEKEKQLDSFFDNKKLYMRIALILFGGIIVFYLFRKMKQEYT